MIVVRMQKTLPLRVAEWTMASILTTLGAMLWAMPDYLSEITRFNLIGEWAPQWVWAAVFCLIGSLRLLTLTINGAWRSSPSARAMLAFMTALVWLTFTLGLMAAPRHGMSLAIFPWLLILEFWNVHMSAGDARDSLHRIQDEH